MEKKNIPSGYEPVYVEHVFGHLRIWIYFGIIKFIPFHFSFLEQLQNFYHQEIKTKMLNDIDSDTQASVHGDRVQISIRAQIQRGFICLLSRVSLRFAFTSSAKPELTARPPSQAVMQDPVLIPESGYSYERKHIKNWLDSQMSASYRAPLVT
jgi:hypothetical protein